MFESSKVTVSLYEEQRTSLVTAMICSICGAIYSKFFFIAVMFYCFIQRIGRPNAALEASPFLISEVERVHKSEYPAIFEVAVGVAERLPAQHLTVLPASVKVPPDRYPAAG